MSIARQVREMRVQEFADQAVERFWRFQVCQVTGAAKYMVCNIGNSAAHERMHGDAGLVVLTDDEQNWHL